LQRKRAPREKSRKLNQFCRATSEHAPDFCADISSEKTLGLQSKPTGFLSQGTDEVLGRLGFCSSRNERRHPERSEGTPSNCADDHALDMFADFTTSDL